MVRSAGGFTVLLGVYAGSTFFKCALLSLRLVSNPSTNRNTGTYVLYYNYKYSMPVVYSYVCPCRGPTILECLSKPVRPLEASPVAMQVPWRMLVWLGPESEQYALAWVIPNARKMLR